MKAVDSLGEGATGVFGVELFLAKKPCGDLEVLLNEVAPRPHNTGHYTQDACAVSQFENHLRAVCGLPLGDTKLIVGAAASEYHLLYDVKDHERSSIDGSNNIGVPTNCSHTSQLTDSF